MSDYLRSERIATIPRLPMDGSVDLTYRCNNNCRHCWLRMPQESPQRQNELTTDEIKAIVDEARRMGCQRWAISGGEPMLRPDFPEIFEYITKRSISYSINTNGTMITPDIAELMRRKGRKMVAIYGANADTHDHITRNPGSFEDTMRGFELLKKAGAEFTVQIIPMKDNYHQFQDMVRLAKSISSSWRVGAAWLYLSADGDPERNAEIERQRLDPSEVVELDNPDMSYEVGSEIERNDTLCHGGKELFASCIASRRDFHIDPYGLMSFCIFIKDPQLRYDLRKGSFREAWEDFIPSLASKVTGEDEYLKNCGSCHLRSNCRWCPVYGYLEHRRLSAPVEYLCRVAKENLKFKENWDRAHRRYFSCAGITIKVESRQPIDNVLFHPTFKLFETNGPSEDMITIRYHSELPPIDGQDLGEVVYQKGSWVMRRRGESWIYQRSSKVGKFQRIAVFGPDCTRIEVYRDDSEGQRELDLGELYNELIFLTQAALAKFLARHDGCFLHSGGVILGGRGILFLGHSGAGKSTLRRMVLSRTEAQSLCDDRNVLRRWADAYMVHGVWANKDLLDVSSALAPLGAMIFLEQAKENSITLLENKGEILRTLLPCVIRPVESSDWWNRTLTLVGKIVGEVPFYRLRFDLSGRAVDLIQDICLWH